MATVPPIAPIIYINKSESSFCVDMLKARINNSVRVIDVCVLIPTALFFLFLLLYIRRAFYRLRATHSPLIITFYVLVNIVALFTLARSAVSLYLNKTIGSISVIDRILWLSVRFLTLFIEMVVIVFCLGSANRDSRSSIRRALVITSFIAFTYSTLQSLCEFLLNKKLNQHNTSMALQDVSFYEHGGSWFLFCSSFLLFMVYTAVLILPLTRMRNRISLPTKKAFYIYCFFLALLNLLQASGALLYYFGFMDALCLINVGSLTYMVTLNPLIYFAFLWRYFHRKSMESRAQNPMYITVSHSEYTINSGSLNTTDTVGDRIRRKSLGSTSSLVCDDNSVSEYSQNQSYSTDTMDPTIVGVPELLFNRSSRSEKGNSVVC